MIEKCHSVELNDWIVLGIWLLWMTALILRW